MNSKIMRDLTSVLLATIRGVIRHCRSFIYAIVYFSYSPLSDRRNNL